jgi:uncharacterized damage-inducible protein DinB
VKALVAAGRVSRLRDTVEPNGGRPEGDVVVDAQERKTHLETLRATPARLKAALSGVPKALALWTPAPGKWSILEIVCHMRDMERDAYLERFRRILAEQNPTLPDIDGDRCSLEGDYRGQKLSEVFRDWKRLRRETLRVLAGLKQDQWARMGTHETAGPLSVDDFVRRLALGNDEAHLGQIEAIKRRFAILGKLEAGPRALSEATRGLSDEALRRRPAPDKWSVIENACHIRDVERVYVERFTKTAHSDRPRFWMIDNDSVAEKLRYREADLASVLREFKRLRADGVSLLRALPLAYWQRTGLHPKRGELTLERLAELAHEHTESHLARIRELRGSA